MNPPERPRPLILYGAFVLSGLLSAVRDLGAESLFKGAGLRAQPALFLFLSCLITQICALLFVKSARSWDGGKTMAVPLRQFLLPLGLVNLFTFFSFFTYFLAIESPVGAGFNALIAFGGDPVFTALAAIFFLKERLERRFLLTCLGSAIGIVCLTLSTPPDAPQSTWRWGTLLSLSSTFFYAMYMVYIKRLLAAGFSTPRLVFYRFLLSTVVLGILTLWEPKVPALTVLLICGFSAMTFALPIFLFVYTIRFLTLKSISVLFFLNPILTLLLSCALGRTVLSRLDIFAVALIMGSIWMYEMKTLRKQT